MFQDKSTSAARLIDEFRNVFTTIDGALVNLWSDNRIFPSAEFQDFLCDSDVGWGLSSPQFRRSNGREEAGIKAIKALVTSSCTGGSFDKTKMAKALILYRNALRLGLQSQRSSFLTALFVMACPRTDGPTHQNGNETSGKLRNAQSRPRKKLLSITTGTTMTYRNWQLESTFYCKTQKPRYGSRHVSSSKQEITETTS